MVFLTNDSEEGEERKKCEGNSLTKRERVIPKMNWDPPPTWGTKQRYASLPTRREEKRNQQVERSIGEKRGSRGLIGWVQVLVWLTSRGGVMPHPRG